MAGVLFATNACGGSVAQPPQPIAFSHRVHADVPIGCTGCHAGAATHAQASLPPVTACAVCHRAILTDHPEIQKLLRHLEDEEPIRWRKVNVMPASAMVRFAHKPHARAGIECATCHGEVHEMTVARRVIDTARMGWCVQCHRANDASDDCLTCHY